MELFCIKDLIAKTAQLRTKSVTLDQIFPLLIFMNGSYNMGGITINRKKLT